MGTSKSHSPVFAPRTLLFSTPDVASANETVVGRDGLSDSLWEALEASSIRLLAERRMGKTWLLKLAMARKPSWTTAAFFDAQQAESAPDFVLKLSRELHVQGLIQETWWQKTQEWFRILMLLLGGKKVGPVEVPDNLVPWSKFLTDTCRHVVEQHPSQTVVLIFDELPLFLDKLVTAERSADAVTFLDTLRFLRGEHSLKMVFCGSLGLHIVLSKLHSTGYSGRPVNDMHPFEVRPLVERDAAYLAGCLLTGERVSCRSVASAARAVAYASSGCPFYIQKLVQWMKERNQKAWTAKTVEAIVEAAAVTTGDPFEFHYYDGRLNQHYPEDTDLVDRARIVLDILSREAQGLTFEPLLNLVRHNPKTLTLDPNSLLEVLRILRDDHYLVENDTAWRFKLEIIRQGWYYMRGRHAL